jgi:hypothetical protein
MPVNVLASPSFLTGPQDNLVTVDVYTGTSGGIVNSIKSLEAKYNVDLIGMLRAGAAAAQLVPVIEGIANGKLLMNPQAALARLLTASNRLVAAVGGSSLNSAFSALSSGVQSAIGEAGQVLGQIEATVGGVVNTIVNGAVGDIQALGAVINGFANDAGAFLMVDTQALAGMAAGVINQCAAYGISGAFEHMVKNITNPYVLNSIVAQTLPSLIRTGDLTSLQSLSMIASSVGISAVNPSLLPSFVQSYNRSLIGSAIQRTPYQDGATYVQMMATFNTADPTWNVSTRSSDGDDDDAVDISSLLGGTDDFTGVLASGVMNSSDPVEQMNGLATVYQPSDVDTDLKAMYPTTYIDPALRSTDVPTEPEQAAAATPTVDASTSTTAVQAPTTYQNIGGTTYRVTNDGNGEGWRSNAINVGDGVAHGDGTNNYYPVSSGEATPATPPASDKVGSQPNPGTYKVVNGQTYQTVKNEYGGTETYLVAKGEGNGQAWSSTGINFGGVDHGDGTDNYFAVDPVTLQRLTNSG